MNLRYEFKIYAKKEFSIYSKDYIYNWVVI